MDRFTPYEGTEPYVFISYSRGDSGRMLEAMTVLRAESYRLWYDEGIPGGNDWSLYIANHLNASAAVVFFLSGSSIVSPNCLNEMMSAKQKKICAVCAVLDECGELIRSAVEEKRSLTNAEVQVISLATAEQRAARKSGARIPNPDEWVEALRDVSFIDGTQSGPDTVEKLRSCGLLTDKFKGSYDKGKVNRGRLNRWLVAIAACFCALGTLLYGGVKVYNETAEANAPAEITPAPTPRPTVDVSLIPGISAAVDFPDAQQERAVRRLTGISEGEVEDSVLAVITELSFCGRTVLTSAQETEWRDGECRANGVPVAQGEISELSLIKKMYYLERASLVYQNISSVTDLAQLQVLRYLDISGNPITELDLSGGFNALEELNISHTGIKSLRGISVPKALRRIYVSADMLPMELDADAQYEVVLVR